MVDDLAERLPGRKRHGCGEFRDGHHPASETPGDRRASILAAVARAAVATRQRSQRMERVSNLLERSGLSPEESRELLLQAWETAVARQLGDVGIDLDREAALLYYAPAFRTWTTESELDHHWRAQGCCASSFRVLPLPNRPPVWSPSACIFPKARQRPHC